MRFRNFKTVIGYDLKIILFVEFSASLHLSVVRRFSASLESRAQTTL